MKCYSLALLVLGLAVAQEELPLAAECDVEVCQLPDCRCSSEETPGGLAPRDTPQFVVLTFDNAITFENIHIYRQLGIGRTNSNGCTAGSTAYVNHLDTEYQLINDLYNNGMEIALHSISRPNNQTYWSEATKEEMLRQFGDQRIQMAHFANISTDQIKGIRIPTLQMTGNASFEAMAATGLTYDNSWPANNLGLWPYTLDYASTQDCFSPPCPTASIPGVWVFPMLNWEDLDGDFCTMLHTCNNPPDYYDPQAWFNFLVTNFERHYLGNRAPFGIYVQSFFFEAYPWIQTGLSQFLNLVNHLNDAYMVTAAEVIDWVKDPVPVNEYVNKPCRSFPATTCAHRTCGPYSGPINFLEYWMESCNECPRAYPWIGNPLGE